MNNPRILITGADSQLGQSLAKLASTLPADFVFATRNVLDITDNIGTVKYFGEHQFDFCINTAAYTKVDQAEQEVAAATQINEVAPGFLATLCKNTDCKLIHISSDYVYHNGLTRPLKEDDPVTPQSVYAHSKLNGENVVLEANPNAVIIRTSWLFSEFGHNFVKTMARLITAGKPLRIVNDQIGCPTYASDLALAILTIIRTLHEESSREDLYGIFNYCNEGPTTWYDFALEIAAILEITPDITPVSTEEYGAVAARPTYSVLDTTKIKSKYGIGTRHWREGLGEVLRLRSS
jgi:dTDP-4-dehydrorhamnose reductase